MTEVAVIGVYDFISESILSATVRILRISAVAKAEGDGEGNSYHD